MRLALVLPMISLVAACSRDAGNPAPPRIVGGAMALPHQSSVIVVPVVTQLSELAQGLNASTPHDLWTIDEKRDRCVAARHVNLGVAKVKVTPDLGCRLVGSVVRGPITIGGSGQRLVITLPVRASLSARKIGGVASETATGTATVHAVAHLSIRRDWQPQAKIDIDYDWREPPGIDILGQRITFADKADAKLKGVVAKLERDLPRELAKIELRHRLDDIWRQAFTSIQLNSANPPAWLRLTPRALGFGGYQVIGRELRMTLAAEALTETFVGDRPMAPTAAPLPDASSVPGQPGLRFFIPVLADYAQLEPVVARTLRKLAAKGISLTGVGPVDAQFGTVTIYATTGNRIAIGVRARVKPKSFSFGKTQGEIWLSALPYNDPGSQLVRARDVRLATRTDSSVVNLLVALFSDSAVQASIQQALNHDFAPDYQKVLIAARRAIGARREGDFVISATVDDVRNGTIQVTGDGLFMPVQVAGKARIEYHPH